MGLLRKMNKMATHQAKCDVYWLVPASTWYLLSVGCGDPHRLLSWAVSSWSTGARVGVGPHRALLLYRGVVQRSE